MKTAWVALVSVLSAMALAAPQDGTVVSGSATIQSAGNVTTVTSTTRKAIVNWQGFSLGPNEIARFVQPNRQSAVLNRVTGSDPSAILGALRSNGQVFLINPNGILFGPTARVDVGSLTASTLSLSDQDFLSGNLRFTDGNSALINQGLITAKDGVHLISPLVDNEGTIQAPAIQLEAIAQGHREQPQTDLLQAIASRGLSTDGLAVNGGTLEGDTIVVTSSNATVLAPGSRATATTSIHNFSHGSTVFSPGAELRAPFVEVSGTTNVVIQGHVSADTFLIDPTNLTIVNGSGGSQDGTLPDVFFGDANLGANTVSEQALEAQTASVVLQATNSITVNDIADGEITLQNNVGLTLQTQTGSIVFIDANDTVKATGTGALSVSAGGGATLGRFVTQNQAITLATGGATNVRQANAGASDVTLTTSAGDLTLSGPLSGGNVTLNVAGKLVGNAAAGLDVTATSLQITTGDKIGTSTIPIETDADTIAATGTSVFLTNQGPTLANGIQATAGALYLTSGTISLNRAGANPAVQASGQVRLTTTGDLTGDSDDTAADVVSSTLLINSGGAVSSLETSAGHVDLTSAGAAKMKHVPATALIVDNANVTGSFTLTAGGDITFTNANITTGLFVDTPGDVFLEAATAGNATIAARNIEALDADNADDLVATTLNLTASQGIGQGWTLDVRADLINAEASLDGIEFFSRNHDLHAGNLKLNPGANPSEIKLITVGTGDIVVDSVRAVGLPIRLTSVGAIREGTADPQPDVVGVSLNATAATSIDLQTSTTGLTLQAPVIDVRNSTTAPSTRVLALASGPVSVTSTGNDLAVAEVRGTSANLSGKTLSEFTPDAAIDITSDTVTLTSQGAISSSNALELDAAQLTANSVGNIRLTQTGTRTLSVTATGGDIVLNGPALELNNLTGGAITVSTTSGDILVGTVAATRGVILQSAGRIAELAPGAATDVTAGANSRLRAAQDVNDVEVQITGSLSVLAETEVGGVSVSVNGTVSPTNTLIKLNAPPGTVLFNGVPVP